MASPSVLPPALALRLPLLKKLAGILAALVVVVLLFLWLALPRIIQSQAEAFVTAKTGHRLSMARPQFNPFNLSLRLAKFELADPEGKPLLSFDELLVDVSAASLPRRALVFDAIRLDGLEISLVELPGSTLNWSPFLAALQDKEEKPASPGLPRLDIHSFILADGRLDFADRRGAPGSSGFATRVAPIELSLTDLSTLPDDSGKFKIEARTSLGAQIALAGAVDLNPMVVSGTFNLEGLKLESFAPYLNDRFPAGVPVGTAGLFAAYRAGSNGKSLDVTVDQVEVRIDGLQLPLAADGAGLDIGSVLLQGGKFNLAKREAVLGSLVLQQGRFKAVRTADGRIPVVEALQAFGQGGQKPAPDTAKATPENPWHFRLGQAELANWSVSLRDEGVSPAVDLTLEKISLHVAGITENLNTALPVKLSFQVGSGGSFEANGKIVPAGPQVDIKLKLTELALKPAEPYLAQRALLDIASGHLSSQGRVSLESKSGRDQVYRGDFALRNLKLNVAGTPDTLVAWKSFGTDALTASARGIDIGELRLNGLDAKLVIAKDKSSNVQKILKPASTASDAATAPAATDPAPVGSQLPVESPSFVVNVGRLRFYNGEMDFADHSLVLPFGTRIHKLRGTFNNLSSRSGGGPGQIEIEGEVDEYGMARAVGQVNLFNPTGFMDIRVLFKNVEMTRLTPYTATFAGRKIDSGKLSLDLQYQIKQRQMQGENQVVIDRLVLGERIESSSAMDLPLDLALAVLRDSDGRIDLGLPVSGSLDDPEFSYGSIVWKAIRNVLSKIVTAPFRALASLFGGGEKIESIAFEAGSGKLTPPEREKLVRLAGGLAKRPGLVLAVGGLFAEADRVALQDVQLRRTVLGRAGQSPNENWDPGPLATSQPAVREALEKLYGERFGASDLAAQKEGFRKANPGQFEEGLGGRMMSRLSGMLREKKTLSEDEVAGLKGADFHSVLYDRLREKEAVGDDRLQALAQTRVEFSVAILKAAGLAADHLQMLAPERGESFEGGIPLRLALEAMKKN